MDASLAETMKRTYAVGEQHFLGWCSRQDLDPSNTSWQQHLNCLAELHDEGRGLSTRSIEGIRMAISRITSEIEGKPWAEKAEVKAFMKGMKKEFPKPMKDKGRHWEVMK